MPATPMPIMVTKLEGSMGGGGGGGGGCLPVRSRWSLGLLKDIGFGVCALG